MSNIVILDADRHRSLRVRAEASVQLGDGNRFVQIVIREFPLAAIHYPIFLSKDADTGAFFCGAMLGIDPGENLFLDAGGGMRGYRPLNLQRGPFFISGGKLAIDLANSRVNEIEGESLFDEAGTATIYLESISNAFRELRPGIEMTRIFIDTVLRYKLVEPIDINLSFDDGETRELRDLYTIDHEAMRALPDEVVVELFRVGYLHLMSLMIASVKQVPVLAEIRNRRLLPDADRQAPLG